jgi:hypothetical protein
VSGLFISLDAFFMFSSACAQLQCFNTHAQSCFNVVHVSYMHYSEKVMRVRVRFFLIWILVEHKSVYLGLAACVCRLHNSDLENGYKM